MLGTVWITLPLNQDSGWRVARLLTLVGLRRGSIGPPIMVIERGVVSPREAISEIAASTGTVGWHTEITCSDSAPMWRMNSCT
ncbi:MAG: hypothetical protein ABT19_14105 [Rhodanobacter sp. SCN 68-63]|nr:MAG: hypothetical protein ABT19_14105 [Rhodanobacter sp. SCN 68-63]